jgi:hypothetical protein
VKKRNTYGFSSILSLVICPHSPVSMFPGSAPVYLIFRWLMFAPLVCFLEYVVWYILFMVGCGLSYVLLTRDSKNICRTKVYDVPNRITMYVNLIYLTANFRVTTTYTSLNQKCFSVQNSSFFCTQFFFFCIIWLPRTGFCLDWTTGCALDWCYI